jgi:anthranilate phosphoribosyltransferase
LKTYLNSVLLGTSLSQSDAKRAAEMILRDEVPAEQISELLIALRSKKETSDEILGFLTAIRETTAPFPVFSHDLMDVCGTGGDGSQTFNVSTGVALVLASLGIKIAKHGNRSVSSKSGSSDVLQALQISNDLCVNDAITSLEKNNISFLFAPAFYPVLAKIAQIRRNIGTYTLFNALGPLLNPAPITHQLMGVYDSSLLLKCAEALRARGVKRAFVVHGNDGLDELTLSGETQIANLENGEIKLMTVSPEDFGLARASSNEVRGGGPDENAKILLAIFSGEKSAKRDLIVMNAAAGLVLSGKESNFKEAAKKVEAALDSGKTSALVESLKLRTRNAS